MDVDVDVDVDVVVDGDGDVNGLVASLFYKESGRPGERHSEREGS